MGSGPSKFEDDFEKQTYECNIKLDKVEENIKAFLSDFTCGACLVCSICCCCCGLCVINSGIRHLEDSVIILNQLKIEVKTLEDIYEADKKKNDPKIENKTIQLNKVQARYRNLCGDSNITSQVLSHGDKLTVKPEFLNIPPQPDNHQGNANSNDAAANANAQPSNSNQQI